MRSLTSLSPSTGAAPVQDTPVYDENLTPTLPPQSQPPPSQPPPSQPQPSSLEPPPLRQVPGVPSIMAPQSRSVCCWSLTN